MSKARGLIYGDLNQGLTISRIDIEGADDGDAVEFVIFNGTASQRIRVHLAQAAQIAADLTELTRQ